MINRKPIASTAILCLSLSVCALTSLAQGKAKHMLPKLTPADFTLPANAIVDSNSNAVILADLGDVHFIGNKNGWFSYVYVRQTRIKILNKNAFDLATVRVGLYGKDENIEQLSNVSASSYVLENGVMVPTKMDPRDVYSTRTDKHWTEAKFSVPGVKEGAILEYTYTITSPYDYHLPSWEFQRVRYPCLSSEYHVEIPQTLNYVLVRQGVHPYAVDKGSTGNGSYAVTEKADPSALGAPDRELMVSAVTVKHDWVMKDIPAFTPERYLTTPDNYIDKISFQQSSYYTGQESIATTNTWAKATEELLTGSDFGGALNDDQDAIADLADKIPQGTSILATAKAAYYYVSRHFTCINFYDKYVRTNLRDVIRNNSGTVGEINLLLTGILRRKGFEADPVLLSTRDYGFNMASYPMMEKLNYVIVRLHVGDRIYYLDAARPQLAFGTLTDDCYNGHARIISNKDSGSVYFSADSLKESKVTMVLMAATDKGLGGTWQSTLGKQESYGVRRRVAEHGEAQFFKDIQTSWGDDAQISDGGIDSVDRLEDPVKVHYDFQLKQQPGASLLYLYPVMGGDWRKNPFTAAERKYPVEMYYAVDQTYIFSLMIPDGYVVDELPKSAKVSFNGDQGYFEYLIVNQGGQVQLRCRVRLNKAWFSADDYSSLRDFFAFIVKKENEEVVLKKQ